jgi:hypothetical protein
MGLNHLLESQAIATKKSRAQLLSCLFELSPRSFCVDVIAWKNRFGRLRFRAAIQNAFRGYCVEQRAI